MFLIPFILRKNKTLNTIFVFLKQGKLFLQEENIEEFLKTNELYYKMIKTIGKYCYIEIDSDKTDLKAFYTYNENSDVECWRRFIVFTNDELHINNKNPEFIQSILKKILELNKE